MQQLSKIIFNKTPVDPLTILGTLREIEKGSTISKRTTNLNISSVLTHAEQLGALPDLSKREIRQKIPLSERLAILLKSSRDSPDQSWKKDIQDLTSELIQNLNKPNSSIISYIACVRFLAGMNMEKFDAKTAEAYYKVLLLELLTASSIEASTLALNDLLSLSQSKNVELVHILEAALEEAIKYCQNCQDIPMIKGELVGSYISKLIDKYNQPSMNPKTKNFILKMLTLTIDKWDGKIDQSLFDTHGRNMSTITTNTNNDLSLKQEWLRVHKQFLNKHIR